jgi:uncharacterized membrane protein
MAALVLGLVLFLGMHSVRIFAEGWRTASIELMGELPWKALYSLLSIAGFVLLVWGYGLARQQPVMLWGAPPVAMRHVASLLTLASFVLLVAAYVPGNALKRRLRHPMIIGVKVWALAHLLANNTLADVVLFGSFLAWAVLDFRAARRRDRDVVTRPLAHPQQTLRTIVTVVVGVAAWAGFAFWAHGAWIGVRPMG